MNRDRARLYFFTKRKPEAENPIFEMSLDLFRIDLRSNIEAKAIATLIGILGEGTERLGDIPSTHALQIENLVLDVYFEVIFLHPGKGDGDFPALLAVVRFVVGLDDRTGTYLQGSLPGRAFLAIWGNFVSTFHGDGLGSVLIT
jgi:hypothetical protein